MIQTSGVRFSFRELLDISSAQDILYSLHWSEKYGDVGWNFNFDGGK